MTQGALYWSDLKTNNKLLAEIRRAVKGRSKKEVLKAIETLDKATIERLLYDWEMWARPNQLIPEGDWVNWVILAGRGWGKTRTGAETVRRWQEDGAKLIGLIGQTPGEVRKVMIEGESGIINISPPWNKPVYQSSKAQLLWPNGAVAHIYSAENPEVLRGPQHEKLWFDELAKFSKLQDTWDNAMLGLRLGKNPQAIITTTPRPVKILKDLLERNTTVITKGSTFENAPNLAQAFIDLVVGDYDGTRLGRQELYGELLADVEGALWNRDLIEKNRVSKLPEMLRIVVAIDPAVTSEPGSDETGIVVAGLGVDFNAYVLEDISIRGTPTMWAKSAITAFYKWNADRIIGEANNGGDMIETVIRGVDNSVSYKKVWASRGKITRAEPIVSLYEQEKVKHVGYFSELEDEMCQYILGAKSPNRMDALVWAVTELAVNENRRFKTISKSALNI